MSAARQLAPAAAGHGGACKRAGWIVFSTVVPILLSAAEEGSPASSGWTAPKPGALGSPNPCLCAIAVIRCEETHSQLGHSRCRSVAAECGQRCQALRPATALMCPPRISATDGKRCCLAALPRRHRRCRRRSPPSCAPPARCCSPAPAMPPKNKYYDDDDLEDEWSDDEDYYDEDHEEPAPKARREGPMAARQVPMLLAHLNGIYCAIGIYIC